LLTGLVTDTLGFRTSNMTPHALRTAAGLMESGADLPELYRLALVSRSYPATRLWGAGLSRLKREGRLVWTTLSLADRKITDYPGRDDADLISVLASIQEADIAMIFQEQANRRVKVSWRAQPGIDVSQIAVRFGGGGHPAASGAELEGDLESVQETILAATRPLLEGAG
jgi:phosphoesterase RecJ-like protein